jgi:hypothetical protein
MIIAMTNTTSTTNTTNTTNTTHTMNTMNTTHTTNTTKTTTTTTTNTPNTTTSTTTNTTTPVLTSEEQVERLVGFNTGLTREILQNFLVLDHDTLYKIYKKPPLVEIAKKLEINTSANKPILINNIYSYLLRKLQTNNDPINSLPPPPPVITLEHNSIGTIVLFDCQYSRPQKYPT